MKIDRMFFDKFESKLKKKMNLQENSMNKATMRQFNAILKKGFEQANGVLHLGKAEAVHWS